MVPLFGWVYLTFVANFIASDSQDQTKYYKLNDCSLFECVLFSSNPTLNLYIIPALNFGNIRSATFIFQLPLICFLLPSF